MQDTLTIPLRCPPSVQEMKDLFTSSLLRVSENKLRGEREKEGSGTKCSERGETEEAEGLRGRKGRLAWFPRSLGWT